MPNQIQYFTRFFLQYFNLMFTGKSEMIPCNRIFSFDV